jgi:hypothetical protein
LVNINHLDLGQSSRFLLAPKLCLGTLLCAKLSLASIFVPRYNLGTR